MDGASFFDLSSGHLSRRPWMREDWSRGGCSSSRFLLQPPIVFVSSRGNFQVMHPITVEQATFARYVA